MTNKTKDGDDNSVVLSTTQEILREDLIEVMADLSPRERDALNLRFGLEDGQQRTIKEVSLLLGLDQERIRQVERDSLTKLRSKRTGHRSSQSDSGKSRKEQLEGKKKPSWRELIYPRPSEDKRDHTIQSDRTDELENTEPPIEPTPN
jgi:hypothetical protein